MLKTIFSKRTLISGFGKVEKSSGSVLSRQSNGLLASKQQQQMMMPNKQKTTTFENNNINNEIQMFSINGLNFGQQFRRFSTENNRSQSNEKQQQHEEHQSKTEETTNQHSNQSNGDQQSTSSSSSTSTSWFRSFFLRDSPSPKTWSSAWWMEKFWLCVIFGIAGSTTVAVVRPFMKNQLGMEGSLVNGPWSYRLLYIPIMTPIYSMILFTVGTVFGRSLYFARFIIKMYSPIMPKTWNQKLLSFLPPAPK